MKKIWKNILIVVLIVSMCVPAAAVQGADYSDIGTAQNESQSDIVVQEASGTDSVGEMLAEAVNAEEQQKTEQKSNGACISELTVEGTIAQVSFSTDMDAEVVVGIYDEELGLKKMLASGKTRVVAGSTSASVEIITEDMPQYFVAAAYLLDPETHYALCDFYISNMYIKKIQDLKKATAKDFDENLVLNLDDSTTTNFGVYSEETVLVKEESTTNQITETESGTYTITDADENLKKLTAGDTFSYTYENGEVLLVKAASVTVNGSTVTVVEDTNADLTDFFDYLKIEVQSDGAKATVDSSSLEEGVTYLGTNTVSEESTKAAGAGTSEEHTDSAGAATTNVSIGTAHKFGLDKKLTGDENDNVTVKGVITFTVDATLEYYLALSYQSISFSMNMEVGVDVSLSGKLTFKEIPLSRMEIPMGYGVNVGFTPAFVVSAQGGIDWKGNFGISAGVVWNSDQGFSNTGKMPECHSELKVEGSIFVGVKAKPFVSIISADLCEASMSFEGGAELKASSDIASLNIDEKHDCKRCIAGEINVKIKVSAGVDVIKGVIKYSGDLFTKSYKICDFHYSFDYNEFEFSKCKHKSYLLHITLSDKDENVLTGYKVACTTENGTEYEIGTTDGNGTAENYIPAGSYVVSVTGTSGDAKYIVSVNDAYNGDNSFDMVAGKAEIKIFLSAIKQDHGTLGDDLTWKLDTDGTLYISGNGNIPDFEDYDEETDTLTPWYADRENIKRAVVEDGVTGIGIRTFFNCYRLKNVTISESVTDIGEYAFAYCYELVSLNIPENLTDIGDYTFLECGSLTSIILPEKIKTIGDWAFRYCVNLASVTMYEGLEEIGIGAFFECSSLVNIALPESLTDIGVNAFNNCKSLKSVSIPKNMTEIQDRVFLGCEKLVTVTVSEGLEEIGREAFSYCYSLTSINFPKSLESIEDYALAGCSNLAVITLQEKLNNIGDYAFSACSSLKEIYFTGEKATIEDNTFYGVSATAYYPESDSTWDEISDEDYGGTITWVAYNPSALNTEAAGESVENVSASEEEELFTDSTDIDSGEQTAEVETENTGVIADDESEATDTEAEIEQDPFASDAKTNENDLSESDEAEIITDMVITETEPPVSYSSVVDAASAETTAMYTNLVPGAPYVFVAVKSQTAQDLLGSENLLYIVQADADNSGSVSFHYILKDNTADCEAVIYGKPGHTHSYGTPQFLWNGTSSCTARFVCSTGSDCTPEEVTCSIVKSVPSYVCTGGTVYTAKAELNGKIYTDTKNIVSEHTWSPWRVVKEASVLTAGIKSRFCSVCKKQDEITLDKLKASLRLSVTSGKTYPLKVKQTYTVKVSGLAKGDKISSWKSSNTKVAAVSKSGKITAKKKGTAKITVKLKSGLTAYIKVKVQNTTVKTTAVKVKNASTGKAVSHKLSLKKGTRLTLKTIVNPVTSRQKVTYTTSNRKIITVSSKGVVKGLKKGTAYITVKSGSKSYKIKVTVK